MIMNKMTSLLESIKNQLSDLIKNRTDHKVFIVLNFRIKTTKYRDCN